MFDLMLHVVVTSMGSQECEEFLSVTMIYDRLKKAFLCIVLSVRSHRCEESISIGHYIRHSYICSFGLGKSMSCDQK